MFALVCIMLVLFPEAAGTGALEGMGLSIKAVSALLPFAVFSGCVIYSGAARVLGAASAPLFTGLFNVSPYGAAAFVTGILGGYPTGVKAICDTLKEGLIDKKEAEKLMGFCNNSGIVFILQTAGIGAFQSVKTGITLYLIHIFSAAATGIILRGKKKKFEKTDIREEYLIYKKERPSSMKILGKSLSSAGGAMVNVCAAVIVFNAVISACSLESTCLCGVIEMTKGVFFAGRRASLSMASFFLSFGGLSVHAQAASIASEYGLGMKKHFRGKLLSAVISMIIAMVITY